MQNPRKYGNSPFSVAVKVSGRSPSYDPVTDESEDIDYRFDIFQSVWKEAAELRLSEGLLKLGSRITCPVVAIHGDTDPHPGDGVREPLSPI